MGVNVPSAPDSPRTFAGDPNPPPQAPKAPSVDVSSAPAPSSAGTGALPPEAQPGLPGRPPEQPDVTYSVVQAPDGSRGVFEWSKDGPKRLGDVAVADADKVLHAAGSYDEASKTWSNIPPDVAKSLMAGRLGFPERVAQAWDEGEAGVVRSLSFARVMNGEATGDSVAEAAHPDVVKARLASNPAVAWQGGFGKTLAAWAEHPAAAAEEGAVTLAGMAPTMKDMLLYGTLPGVLEGGVAGGGAALTAGALSGPLAPEVAAAVMTNGIKVGAAYGTGRRAYDIFGGQFAAQMHDQGYDDEAIRKYAPVAGLVNAALMTAQFDLMTPSMQATVIKKALGSGAVREAIAGALFKFGGRTAGFTALGDAQTLVNDYVGNMAAVAEQNSGALKPGSQVLSDLSQATLSSMLTGGVLAGATGAVEGAAGALRSPSQAYREQPALDLSHGKPTFVDGEPGQSQGSAAPAASETASRSLEGTSAPGQPESPAPYQASIQHHPEAVKAAEAAKPVLEREGVDVNDPKAVLALNEKIRDDAHDFRNAVSKEYMTGSPDRRALLEKEMQQHADDIVRMDKLAKIARDPQGAAAYYEAVARGETPEKAPVDPYDEKRFGTPQVKPAAGAGEPKFFKPSQIDVQPQETDRLTGDEARQQIVGEKNEQIVRGNQIFDRFEKAIPDEGERAAINRFRDAGGDRETLRGDFEAFAEKEAESQGAEAKYWAGLKGQVEAALNLPPEAQKWAKTLDAFYEQAHEEGQARGTLDAARENYANRLYSPDEEEKSLNPGTKANALRRTTTHSFERFYDRLADAELDGRKLATYDAAALARIYNEELAGVNANRAGLDDLAEKGLGKWSDKAPAGWTQVGDLEKRTPLRGPDGKAILGEDGNQIVLKHNFYAPPGIAEGLKPLVDLDWTRKIPLLKTAIDFQNAVKSGLLSMSFFHDFTILSQAVNQHAIGALLRTKALDGLLDEDTFKNSEQYGVRHGLITHEVTANIDIVRSLIKEPGIADGVKDSPIVKQVLELNDKHTQFLFGKLSRYLKVMDFARQAANWEGKNAADENGSAVEPEKRVAAMRQIAKQVNAAYGGQNWEAMGMTKANLSLMRLAFLAPDWLVSNGQLAKMALGDFGVAGAKSRAHFVTGLALGVVATEGLNKLFTGHFTDENKKGHKLEVEVSPSVYVSLFRGASGEAEKLGSMMSESKGGASVGLLRYGTSKIAPLPRAAVTLTGVAADHRFPDYYGKPIIPAGAGTVEGTYDLLKNLLQTVTPVPFSATALYNYFNSSRPTAAGTLAIGSGVGRYSKPPKKRGD